MKSVFIISGEKGSGKSTFLLDVLALLQSEGFVVNGFVALHGFESDIYSIKNVLTNEEALVMKRVAKLDKRPNHFKIFPQGVEKGHFWIKEIFNYFPDIAVIDEIGGFELTGELWSNDFTKLMESATPLIFTVKTKHLDQVVKKWNIKPTFIFDPVDFGNPRVAFEKVKELL